MPKMNYLILVGKTEDLEGVCGRRSTSTKTGMRNGRDKVWLGAWLGGKGVKVSVRDNLWNS